MSRTDAIASALKQLEAAVEARFRRLLPDHMRQDRAFQMLREHAAEKSKELLATLR